MFRGYWFLRLGWGFLLSASGDGLAFGWSDEGSPVVLAGAVEKRPALTGPGRARIIFLRPRVLVLIHSAIRVPLIVPA
jgi:hypothetical protein